jgi:predicted metal-dependent enzyme (double-stranded beta helix superfamily)
MAYDLDQFIADCRTSLERDPGPGGREEVRARLERLLANPEFVKAYCGDDAPTGIKILYEDPKLGFQVLSHCYEKPNVSPPHDHGASWAIYGQAAKYTDMTEWERTEKARPSGHADLTAVKKYRLNPGQAGIYQDGRIHSIDYPAKARFVRVTGVDLEKIPRHKFDIATGAATRMEARTTN